MEAKLTAVHGKVARYGSKDPAVEGLAETFNKLTSRVHQAEEQICPVTDTELIDLLVNLHITPEKPADEGAIQAVQVWATLEDQEYVVETMRLDAMDEMTAQLKGRYVKEGISLWTRKRTAVMRARGAGALRHRPTLNFRRTSVPWRGQRRRAAMQTPPSTCTRPEWRRSQRIPLRQCDSRT